MCREEGVMRWRDAWEGVGGGVIVLHGETLCKVTHCVKSPTGTTWW